MFMISAVEMDSEFESRLFLWCLKAGKQGIAGVGGLPVKTADGQPPLR